MYLKKAPWAEDLLSSASVNFNGDGNPLPRSIVDLVKTLKREREYREITLSLTTALRNATAEFSFLRARGLSMLLKFLSSFSQHNHMIQLFQETQTIKDLQVVPVLFEYSLTPSKHHPKQKQTSDDNAHEQTTRVTSPSSDNEVVLALRVLEGCCLLDRGSRTLAHQHLAIKELVDFLSAGAINQQSACLDALIALMLESPENQKEFERCRGVRKVAQLVKTQDINEKVRLKCAEFLLLLVGNVLPSTKFTNSVAYGEEKEQPYLQDDILELLGEEIASLLWAVGQLGSFDSQKKQPSLHFQALQLVDTLDSKVR